jgi:hypothetical protein
VKTSALPTLSNSTPCGDSGYVALAGASSNNMVAVGSAVTFNPGVPNFSTPRYAVVEFFEGQFWKPELLEIDGLPRDPLSLQRITAVATDGTTYLATGCDWGAAFCGACTAGAGLYRDASGAWHTVNIAGGTPTTLSDVAADGANDYWVVGTDNSSGFSGIYRSTSDDDGLRLDLVENAAATTTRYLTVAASGSGRLFVGGSTFLTAGFAWRIDDGSAVPMAAGLNTPDPSPIIDLWVDATRVFALSEAGLVYRLDESMSMWNTDHVIEGQPVRSFAGVPGGPVSVLGANGSMALLDNHGWRDVVSETDESFLTGAGIGDRIWALSAKDVHRFDGTARASRLESSTCVLPDPGTAGFGRGVFRSGGTLAAVGYDTAWVAGSNGEDCDTLPTALLNPKLWGRSGSDLYAVGSGHLLSYDGQDWQLRCSAGPGAGYRGVTGDAVSVFLVGYTDSGGAVTRWNGVQCEDLDFPASEDATGAWGTGDELYVTAGTTLHVSDSGGWSVVNDFGVSVYGVWGSGAEIWVVGSDGFVGYTGDVASGVWMSQPSFTARSLVTVLGTSRNDVWAYSQNGEVVHWDGGSWAPVPLGLAGTNSMWPTPERVVFGGDDVTELIRARPWYPN